MRRLLPLLLVLVLAPEAHAATFSGAAADPEGDAPAAGVDIVAASWSYDDAGGTIGIVVTLKAAPDAENWGVLNASFRTACEGGTEFATIRVNARSTQPGAASAGNAEDGVQPDGSRGSAFTTATNVKSDDGRTTTSEASHGRLVGRAAGCVRINISHNGVLDAITIPVQETVGEPTPPPPPPPGAGDPGGPPSPSAGPEDVALGSGRRISFRRGKASAGLTGVSIGMTIRLSLRRPDGTTLATAKVTAKATQPALVTMRLTRRGERHLRRHRRGRARLLIRTTLGGSTFQRRYSVTFVKKS